VQRGVALGGRHADVRSALQQQRDHGCEPMHLRSGVGDLRFRIYQASHKKRDLKYFWHRRLIVSQLSVCAEGSSRPELSPPKGQSKQTLFPSRHADVRSALQQQRDHGCEPMHFRSGVWDLGFRIYQASHKKRDLKYFWHRRLIVGQLSGGAEGTSHPELSPIKGRSKRTLFPSQNADVRSALQQQRDHGCEPMHLWFGVWG